MDATDGWGFFVLLSRDTAIPFLFVVAEFLRFFGIFFASVACHDSFPIARYTYCEEQGWSQIDF